MFKEHAAALIYKITGGGIDLRAVDLPPQLATLRPILEQLITDQSTTAILERLDEQAKVLGCAAIREVIAEPYLENGRSLLTSTDQDLQSTPILLRGLLAFKPNCGACDKYNETPIHTFSRWLERETNGPIELDPVELLRKMIRLGGSVWQRDALGELPILRLARSDCRERLKLLGSALQNPPQALANYCTPHELQELLLRLVISIYPGIIGAAANSIHRFIMRQAPSPQNKAPEGAFVELAPHLIKSIDNLANPIALSLDRCPYRVNDLLCALERYSTQLWPATISALLNIRVGELRTPLCISLSRALPNGTETLSRLSKLGATLDTSLKFSDGSYGTLLHDPELLARPDCCALVACIISPNTRDSFGRLPISIALEQPNNSERISARHLLNLTSVEHLPDVEKEALFDQALQFGPSGIIMDLLRRDIGRDVLKEGSWLLPPPYSDAVDAEQLLNIIAESESLVSEDIRTAAFELGYSTTLFHTWLYLNAALEICKAIPHKNGESLNRLLPMLVSATNPALSMPLVKLHEDQMDLQRVAPHSTHHDAELLGLLNNPNLNEAQINTITRSFTSPSRIHERSILTLKGHVVQALALAGLETNDFIRNKWDTRRSSAVGERGEVRHVPSLFEAFGHTFIEGSNQHEHSFYLASYQRPWPKVWSTTTTPRLSDSVTILHQHGCKVFSIPLIGSIAIRNSSRVYGRDLLPHAVSFSPLSIRNGLTEHDLLHHTQDVLREFAPLHGHAALDSALQQNRTLAHLMDAVHGLRLEFSRWKFNTDPATAFAKRADGQPVMLGGFASPGFGPLVELLERQLRIYDFEHLMQGWSKHERPALAFFSPLMPAWEPFTFYFEGKPKTFLSLDMERIELLKALASDPMGSFRSRRFMKNLNETGLADFFQQAGFDTQGDLVVISEPTAIKI